jgi:hypothetical protein
MSGHSDALATAAHLHVLLRRNTGRVTDTEWMASNPDYARAVVAFTRDKAHSENLPDLLPWADKLEALIPLMGATDRKPLLVAVAERLKVSPQGLVPVERPLSAGRVGGSRDAGLATGPAPQADPRYVGGIR